MFNIPDAGINPLPIQRPIPVWFGGHAEPALRRIARLADGWMPNYRSAAEAVPAIELLERSLAEAGRERESLGREARLPYGEGDPSVWEQLVRDWTTLGATHFTINTMGCGFDTPVKHLEALRKFAESMGISR